jgi:two-component system nitrate/nitrite response regulator NarL
MGYFTHDSEPSQIVAALLDGGPYVAQPVATVLLRKVAHSDESEFCAERLLTPRELHVLKLIEKGLSNKEIARTLSVEIATVKNHVHQILSKTRARRRSQAIHMLRR